MKNNELTVGSWVYVAHQHSNMGSDYDLEFIPEQLTLEHFKFWEENDWSYTDFDEFLKPIPITREILEKNGFDCGDCCYAYLRLDNNSWLQYYYFENRLRKYWSGIDEWQNHAEVTDITFQCHCRYVHELQHALRLCIIEKEIKL